MGDTHLRCVSWIAVSSDPQAEKESLPDQQRLNRQFVSNIGRQYPGYTGEIVAELQVVGTRSIVDIADAVDAYPDAYGTLVRMLKAGQVDAIVCRSRDRLGRIDSLTVTIERLCWRYGAIVIPRQSLPVTLDVNMLRDSEGAGLIAGIEGHLARSAVRRLTNENEMGMIARVKAGKFAGTIPYGYKRVYSQSGDWRIEIDQEAATILRRIMIEMYLNEGLGIPTIADRLNSEGLQTPTGRKWGFTSIDSILRNPDRYAGYVHINRKSKRGREYIRVRAKHDAIITEDELAAVEAEVKRRSFKQQRGRGLLNGAVICSLSGKPMHVITHRGCIYYRCGHCMRNGQNGHVISELRILAAIEQLIRQLSTVTDPAGIIVDRNRIEAQRLLAEIDELEHTKKAAEGKKARILRAYVYKEGSGIDFDAEMNRIAARLDELNSEIAGRRDKISRLNDEGLTAARIARIQRAGIEILKKKDAEPEMVKEFLTQSFRVYISNGEKKYRNQIDSVDLL